MPDQHEQREQRGSAPELPTALRVIVADDNPVVRAGLTVLLDGRDDIRVVAEAADGDQALRTAREHGPDVVLLDVRMPHVDGISALPHLVRVAPVLMLTYSREAGIVQECLRLGAGGYLVHGEFTADELVSAVRDIRAGGSPLTATAASALVAHVRGTDASAHGGARQLPHSPGREMAGAWQKSASFQQIPSQAQRSVGQSSTEGPHRGRERERYGLSHREVEVMDLIASGMSNRQIAATCFISEKTVKNHINRIFAKLSSTSRTEAILTWLGRARPTGGGGHV